MPEGDELPRQRLLTLQKEVNATTTARRATKVARALAASASASAAWVIGERSPELLAEASTQRNAECTAVEYLSAELAEDYFAAERALTVPTQLATQPDMTSAKKVEETKSPTLRQQQRQPMQQQDVELLAAATV